LFRIGFFFDKNYKYIEKISLKINFHFFVKSCFKILWEGSTETRGDTHADMCAGSETHGDIHADMCAGMESRGDTHADMCTGSETTRRHIHQAQETRAGGPTITHRLPFSEENDLRVSKLW
jgi:hypothetical protein